MAKGGSAEDVRLWNKTFTDLRGFCDCRGGEIDDMTRDLVLCWAGWVLKAPSATTNLIYDSLDGFNLYIREDADGEAGTTRIYEGIKANLTHPIDVYRELAYDQLERMRAEKQQSADISLAKVDAMITSIVKSEK